MSDDIPAAKRRGRKPESGAGPATESVAIRFADVDFDRLCRVAHMKRNVPLRTMLREWVLDRLGMELTRISQLGTPNIDGRFRVM